jgi:hypothetical protein
MVRRSFDITHELAPNDLRDRGDLRVIGRLDCAILLLDWDQDRIQRLDDARHHHQLDFFG